MGFLCNDIEAINRVIKELEGQGQRVSLIRFTGGEVHCWVETGARFCDCGRLERNR